MLLSFCMGNVWRASCRVKASSGVLSGGEGSEEVLPHLHVWPSMSPQLHLMWS